ncbi:hypothetical protein B0J11DRAFT_501929 [Dendryphion nanum]|uniref:Uncharacterized protein n=1 Tax=Dendryphion nanum TaxID=256645 RepID=A0A9P9IXZ8_9PLEO|nr:hypothetical protein B0J11DRAFT_501929 [Dendryphion nanum]
MGLAVERHKSGAQLEFLEQRFCSWVAPVLDRPSVLAKTIHYHHSCGAFPWLRYFKVIDSQVIGTFDGGTHIFSRIRDVTQNTTLTVPAQIIARQYSASNKRAMFRDTEGRDFIGTEKDILVFMERPIHWRRLANGARSAPTVEECRLRERIHDMGQASLPDLASLIQPPGAHDILTSLREKEELAGGVILRARVSEGIEDEGSSDTYLLDVTGSSRRVGVLRG